MGTGQTAALLTSSPDEVTVSEAAMRTCRGLLSAMSGRIRTHVYRDGGLICEDRSSPARPKMWRIDSAGRLLPDSSYSFTRGAFISTPIPREAG